MRRPGQTGLITTRKARPVRSTYEDRLWNVETLDNGHRQELRDMFATAALTALLGHIPSVAFAARSDENAQEQAHDKIAAEAYRWADAMLKARNQP